MVSRRWPSAVVTHDRDHGWRLHRGGDPEPLGYHWGEAWGAVRALVGVEVAR